MYSAMSDIPGFPGYLIEKDGTIMDKKGQLVSPHYDNKGYVRVNLFRDKNYSKKRANLLALTYIPNPQNKPVVDHINNVRDDDRLENLQWLTWAENAQKRLLSTTNTTGYQNIYPSRGGFEISIVRDGKCVYRHFEKTLEDAVKARDAFLATGEETRKQTATNQKNITKTESGYRVTFRSGSKADRKVLFDKRFKTLDEAILARDSFLASY